MSFKVTWLGHGAYACEIDGHNVLIDPFLTGNPAASTRPDSLAADFILITHGHGDHTGDAEAIAKRTRALIIAPNEIAVWYQEKKGLKSHGQHIGGGYHHPFGYVKLTVAHHGSGLPDGSYGGDPCGYLITAKGGERAYFAGDTALVAEMQFYGDEGIDLACLPIGDNYTMGPDDALRAVKLLRPKAVIPVHYNTFDLIKQDVNAWASRVSAETSAKPVILKPGESYTVG